MNQRKLKPQMVDGIKMEAIYTSSLDCFLQVSAIQLTPLMPTVMICYYLIKNGLLFVSDCAI